MTDPDTKDHGSQPGDYGEGISAPIQREATQGYYAEALKEARGEDPEPEEENSDPYNGLRTEINPP